MNPLSSDRAPAPTPAAQRASALQALARESFDLIVIGGGIGGACTAWDAALRGLKVALVEQADFGGGTSAHSLKVLHGGIRYLQHLDITRLRESCAERGALLRMAPHLTRPMPFALPTFGLGMRGKLPLRAAFQLLNLFTAERNRDIEDPAQQIPPPFILSRSEFLERFTGFDSPGLSGAGVFYDGQILNPPRMVFAIVQAAQAASATALNYVSAEGLLQRDGRVEGIRALDVLTGEGFDIRGRAVANVSGPYAPAFLRKAGVAPLDVPLSRDMAIVVNRRLLPDMGIGIQTRYKDPDAWLSRGNRHLFMAPWRDYTLIGVHSRIYAEDPFALTVTESEIEGFIDEVREACPVLGVRREHIAVVNAGLLPFGENTPASKDLSFGKRSVLVDHGAAGGPRGLISGMSVRWTMGRLLGEQAVDLALRVLGESPRPSSTRLQLVPGANIGSRSKLQAEVRRKLEPTLPASAVTHLADTFGTLWNEVVSIDEQQQLLPGGITLEAEVRYAARREMTATLADIVLRRLDLGTGAGPSEVLLERCSHIAAEELGWADAQRQQQIRQVRASYPFANPASQQGRAA